MQKAFFLDRDGTLNVDYNYVHKPEEWTWCEGAIKAIQLMNKNNYLVIVVTNQSGISKGKYTERDVESLHQWVDQQLESYDAYVDHWLYAAYHPEYAQNGDYNAEWRKPGTGMFNHAQQLYNIDYSQSYMAGDKISDLKPAIHLGINSYFIKSRHKPNQNKKWLEEHNLKPFNNILEIVEHIIS